MSSPVDAFAATLVAVHEQLDWELLGDLYCHEGGGDFFPPEQREAILDAGLRITDMLAEELDALPKATPGRSLYFGAALAELAPILYETLVARREIVWHNLPGAETDELNRALALVEARGDAALPRVDPNRDAVRGEFDHVWCVSVFTDPVRFPTLHDRLYERRGTELAVGGGDRRRDRERAEGIADQLLASLVRPAVLTTTEEELAIFEPRTRTARCTLRIPATGRTSAIVGDVVLVCGVAGRPRKPHARKKSRNR